MCVGRLINPMRPGLLLEEDSFLSGAARVRACVLCQVAAAFSRGSSSWELWQGLIGHAGLRLKPNDWFRHTWIDSGVLCIIYLLQVLYK